MGISFKVVFVIVLVVRRHKPIVFRAHTDPRLKDYGEPPCLLTVKSTSWFAEIVLRRIDMFRACSVLTAGIVQL